jgi:hypothetical protein
MPIPRSKPISKKFVKQPATKSSGGKGIIKIPKLADDRYSLEIYIKYEKLDNKTWVYILKQIETVKNQLITQFKLDQVLTRIASSEIILVPSLDINFIHTGRSVIIRFNEGWRPKVKIKKGDIIIDVPGKVAIAGLILYSFYTGYDKYLDTENKRLDLQIKKNELREKLKNSLTNPDNVIPTKTTVNFIKNINNDINIKYLRINNLVIKNNKE